jgi:hypothetical protein
MYEKKMFSLFTHFVNFMEEIMPSNPIVHEKSAPIQEPEKFTPKPYKARFLKTQAYRLPDDAKIHCQDGTKLEGKAGDYYVCLDNCVEMVLPADLFRKFFIFDHENYA